MKKKKGVLSKVNYGIQFYAKPIMLWNTDDADYDDNHGFNFL